MTQKDDLHSFLTATEKENRRLIYIGIPIVALTAFSFFAFSQLQTNLTESLVSLSISIGVTASIWLGSRRIIIFLWKKYPWEEHPRKHILLEAILVIFWAAISLTVFGFLGLIVSKDEINYHDLADSIMFTVLITLFITALTEGWFFYTRWIKSRHISADLERENLNAQFETLKSQVNPHFLFNSLNTLISIVDGNEKAVSFVQNLSELLRFGLQNKEVEAAKVIDEISIIEKYIYLQQARFKNNLIVNLKVEKEVKENYFLPPMSLQMLVENAIKHNIISKENPLYIDIYNQGNENIIVKNNLQRKTTEYKTGLGIKNISQRYEYLTDKKVIMQQSDNVFMISLPLLKL